MIKNNKHYASKHSNAVLDPKIAKAIRTMMSKTNISCKASHKISSDVGVAPQTIGINIDMMEIRIDKCQLGLFGCSHKLLPAESVIPEVKAYLLTNQTHGKINCKLAWLISKKFRLNKPDISAACDALGIKISECQLGTF